MITTSLGSFLCPIRKDPWGSIGVLVVIKYMFDIFDDTHYYAWNWVNIYIFNKNVSSKHPKIKNILRTIETQFG